MIYEFEYVNVTHSPLYFIIYYSQLHESLHELLQTLKFLSQRHCSPPLPFSLLLLTLFFLLNSSSVHILVWELRKIIFKRDFTWAWKQGKIKKEQEEVPKQNGGNNSLFPRQQTAKHQRHRVVCQPTLRAIGRLAWCMYERGNSENGIFIHEIRSQDSKITQKVLTAPTRTTTRSCAHQFLDNGWFQYT